MLFKNKAKAQFLSIKVSGLLVKTFILLSVSAISFIGLHSPRFPATGVVTELRLDEGTGTNAADGSGNAHNGTLTNGPTWGAGKYGQAVNLDGTNDYINLADHADYTLTPTVSYTWSAWVRNNNFNQWSTVWSQTVSSTNFFYFYAHTTSDAEAGPVTNGLTVYWFNGANKLVMHSNNNVLTAAQWSYVTVTYDASQAQANRFTIYVNGTDVSNRSDVVSAGTIAAIDPTNIRIGSNQPFGEYLNGSVDEVRYYRRLLSVAEIQSDMNIGGTADTQFPTVNITAPAAGNVTGTINVTANASDNVGVVGVQFLLDGAVLGAEDLTSPYSVSWNTATASNGNHNLTARARDAAGNITTSAVVAVNANNDLTAPSVSVDPPLTSPVSGTISITASASDNVGVAGVQFLLDGANLGTEDVTSPFSVSWNTVTATNGVHNLTARARDAAGNTTTSAAVPFTVFNSGLVASFGFNENTGTTANDNSGNSNTGTLTNGPTWSGAGKFGAAIQFDGTNDFVNINDANSLDLSNGMTIEAWVNASNLTGYKTVVCKENGTNNLAYALSANNNNATAANQRPDSRIRIGTTTRTVTGTTKLTLNTWTHLASTYDGTTMRLYVNGVQVATFATTGNITATTNPLRIGGSTALGTQYFAGLIDEVRIYNRALSATEIQSDMNAPIAPDQTNPTVSITAPATGDVSGTVNITATASDNISVTGVQFLLNGNNLGAEDVTAPYSFSWNTTTVNNGTYTLTARARDAAGNLATSDVIVNVNNDLIAPTVTITNPSAGTIVGTINVTANASDNVGVAGVQFFLGGNSLGAEDQSSPYSVQLNTTAFPDGDYYLKARARDAAGNTKADSILVTILNNPPDVEFPTVSITAPVAGDVLGAISITADANDNVGVIGVQFQINGANFGTEDLSAPYSIPWNTLAVSNGSYTLTAKARDAAGHVTTSAAVIVNVNNPPDTELPVVNITSPTGGSNVAGTVNITATATDNRGVAGVEFFLDGSSLGAEDITSPYSFSWNTVGLSNGNHTLTAKARDSSGNFGVSPDVIVNVNNDVTLPTTTITAPANAANVSGTVSITADASDNVGVVGVQFLLDGANLGSEDLSAPYSFSWNTIGLSNGNHTLTTKARDAAGNIGISTGVVVNVNNDITLPTVSITAPSGTVSSTVNITATANDNVGVVGVQFLLDGVNLGTEDLSSPYSFSWNTVGISNGPHTLTAKARDAAGNIGTSTGVGVTVSNNTSLLAALSLNEGTGTNAADLSGNNHNATLSGATWTAGKYGQAINLNGTSNFASMADHADFTLDPAQSYTWSSWVRNTNFNSWGTVWSQTVDANNFFYFYAHTTSDAEAGPVTAGVTVYWWTSNGTNKLVMHSNNNVLTSGQWSHIAITYDASLPQANRITIYVNGVDVTNRTDILSTGTLATINPTNTRIGNNQPFGDYLNGAVDEVRYYNRLLTPGEITTDMNTPIGNDNIFPTVSISSPANGATVTGTINVNANASDNFGVAGVQFLLDGNNLGAEDLTAPYSVSWNTATSTGGNHILSARARDASGNNTTSAGVNVTIASDFSFTVLNPSRNVETTGSADYGVDVTFLNGFTSNNVALSVTGLPANVSANYLVNPLTGAGQTQLHVVSTNATPGTYTLTLSATANSITHTQTATLIVNGAADFTLSSSPSIQTVTAGNGTSYSITVGETGNFVNPVTLSVQGLPTGANASFNPASVVPIGSSTLTITTSASTPTGTYSLTLQGASGALTHTTTITLTVTSTTQTPFPVTTIGSGWDLPIGATFTKNGLKMFVWEKGGKLWVLNWNPATQIYEKQATPVLDISPEVGNWGDHGFNGFALDPNFDTNGLIYLLYVVDRYYLFNFGTPGYNPNTPDNVSEAQATMGRITRYKTVSSGGVMSTDLSTRAILLGETKSTGIAILHDSHGLGSLVFAADGTLLASAGDGADYNTTDAGNDNLSYYQQALSDGIIRPAENVGSFRSQMLNCHNGKILRINPVNGDGVTSNPFYDAAQPHTPKSRVWAFGFRNPFRFSVKPGTGSTNPDAGDIGELYVGDVGNRTYEELDIVKAPGTNCGWPIFEGILYHRKSHPSDISDFVAFNTQNMDEPNPLFGTGGCNQQFFMFRDLIKQVTPDGAKTVFNPCNTSVPIGTGNRYVNRPPSLDWKHDVDSARVLVFNGNNVGVAQIGSAASGVTGTPFRGNCSIGGFWYTGSLFPVNFRNTYFHGDFGAQWIKSFTINFTDVVQRVQDFTSGIPAMSCLVENPFNGQLVYVDIGTNQVKSIGYGGNQLPVVKMSSDVTFGPTALNVNFTGSNSFDPEGGNLTYSWNFGDATTSTVANPSHTFTAPAGTPRKFVVTLTVRDNQNATATDSIIISVNNTPPVVHITSPINNSTYNIGPDSTYAFTATVTDAEQSPSQLKYEWQKILRHDNHEHPGEIDTTRNTFGAIQRIGCNGDTYYWLIRLKVTDAAGLSTMDSSKIFPNCPAERVMLVLRKFSVTQETNQNEVKWITDLAPQVQSFDVERSIDGIHFSPIHHRAASSASDIKEYGFNDNTFPAGDSYYRLRMNEVGDVIRYSAVVKTFTGGKMEGLTIAPNPTTGNFTLRYNAPAGGTTVIQITDLSGRLVTTLYESVNKGQNIIYLQNMPSWKAGIYLISVKQDKDIQRGKLIYQ